ncbi:universal stress protein [Rhizobium sp. P32RR-XVIII]|uniref:universal stress protein n=1 Tax=Rhizobium sp. P32RR-XVIII TaxID=2726738 RepID=UPI00145747B5|nr:universal stress protein [Rhizobium sp. P32RR-XVIII]NLS08237.1 universal stress protein [Rhizobium sp. P32RR-XVIII]
MQFKTVLAVVDADDLREDVESAVALCQSIDAHLSVTVVAIDQSPYAGSYGEAAVNAWLEDRESTLANLAGQIEAVKEMLGPSGLSYEVNDLYTEFAWADEDIAQRALYSDLTLIGQQAARNDDLRRRILDGALFQSSAPVLFNPTNKPATLASRSILVAWDSRPEAARAVQLSLPILQSAAEVHVTLVDPVASTVGNGEEPGADVATYLARHAVKVTVDVLASGGKTVDETLIQHATAVGADLVVMGAYSHSRLRERIFGGVTQSMLEKTELPIFWGH